jgi:hypothetical protein
MDWSYEEHAKANNELLHGGMMIRIISRKQARRR